MEEKVNYALEVSCNTMTFLIPLSCIKTIFPYEDCRSVQKGLVRCGDKEIPGFFLNQILGITRQSLCVYAILLQNEDIEAFLFVEDVKALHNLEEREIGLPGYLKPALASVLSCYMLNEEQPAFLLDICTLLEQQLHN